jgi:hypothetical protein
LYGLQPSIGQKATAKTHDECLNLNAQKIYPIRTERGEKEEGSGLKQSKNRKEEEAKTRLQFSAIFYLFRKNPANLHEK